MSDLLQEFSEQGFVVLRQQLASADIVRYLAVVKFLEAALIDQAVVASPERRQASEFHNPGAHYLNGLLRLNSTFEELLDHPVVLSFLSKVMPDLQFGHSWSISKQPGTGVLAWHRGVTPPPDGPSSTRMALAIYCLTDNGPHDGCLRVVPGSHRLLLPSLTNSEDGYPGMQLVTANAGDVILMSESLFHGGEPNTSASVRTNLYYSYVDRDFDVPGGCPENMAQMGISSARLLDIPERQRRLLRWCRA